MNEKRAIEIADQRYAENRRNCKGKPSEMCSCTTVHKLINEIVVKIK